MWVPSRIRAGLDSRVHNRVALLHFVVEAVG